MPALPTVRARFLLTLALLGLVCLMLLGSVAFAPPAATWVVFGLGLAGLAPAFALLSHTIHRRELGAARVLHLGHGAVRFWPVLAGLFVASFAWEAIAARAFPAGGARGIVFGGAWFLIGLATSALVLHEISSERVVHVLDVSDGRGPRRTRPSDNGGPGLHATQPNSRS